MTEMLWADGFFLVNKIIFKMYSNIEDPTISNKKAMHEMRGHSIYNNLASYCGVRLPLMCVVEYMGFRVLAMSIAPISPATLVYGSLAPGTDVRTTPQPDLGRKLEKTGQHLNLAPYLPAGAGEGARPLYSSATLEGHMGLDANYYLLGYGAVMPAEVAFVSKDAPPYQPKRLRLELVQDYEESLNPDVYTEFIPKSQRFAVEASVERAVDHLKCGVIPRVCKTLNAMNSRDAAKFGGESTLLLSYLHSQGINLRYLGHVRAGLRSSSLRTRLLAEMLARTVRDFVFATLRTEHARIKLPIEHVYKPPIVRALNLVFGRSPPATAFWKEELEPMLERKFPGALSHSGDKRVRGSLRRQFEGKRFALLLSRAVMLLRIRFAEGVMERLVEAGEGALDARPFDVLDIEEFGHVARGLEDLHERAAGYVWKAKAASAQCKALRARAMDRALAHFERSVEENPDNKYTVRHLAGAKRSVGQVEDALRLFSLAAEIDPNDVVTRLRAAQCYEEAGMAKQAAKHYSAIADMSMSHPPELVTLLREAIERLR